MATFTNYTDILPDPSNPIGTAGQTLATGSGGTAGVGFKSVNFSSNAPIMRSRTNSGRLVSRSNIFHKWEIKVGYNPMTQAQFNVIYPFLIEKQGTLKPFLVKLPQYGSGTDLTVAATSIGSKTSPASYPK